jgi:hypothetical protein
MNFKGVPTFLEKYDKFTKIPCSHDIPEYKFILTHLYSNIRSFCTSGKKDFVYFILIMAAHLRILLHVSQVYHYSKLDKKYSKQD